ncbi:MAG TPA: M24 family metallopeptidase [Anaerolineaceae bacterium]
MKSDIDAIMLANDIDVLLVVGPAQHNPAMYYLTGGGHLTGADLIKRQGQPGALFHGPMERDEAAKAAEKNGLLTRSYTAYPFGQYLKEANGDRTVASALRYCAMLKSLGITAGRVALYGRVDLRTAFPVFFELQKQMPGITLVGDVADVIMGSAMITKDAGEVEHIRRMGKITTAVVSEVADYLAGHAARDGVLVNPDGTPVTIGQVKGLIDRWLVERGAENPEGTIFAIGRDAGVPHSSGNPDDWMRLGQTIVFDIYPCEARGGYFYDFTRTWCLGYAPDEVMALYESVRSVYNTLSSELEVGANFSQYQQRACELFEAMGHPTILNTPDTEEGYVHSLGHGVGLHIHERPFSGATALPEDRLAPGAVITLEPGLYYPSRGMGVRLENTLWVRPDETASSRFEVLADYPMDLVLPVKQQS